MECQQENMRYLVYNSFFLYKKKKLIVRMDGILVLIFSSDKAYDFIKILK